MTKTREQVNTALEQLAERVRRPRALEVSAADRAAFEQAHLRAARQLVEELPPVLVVALAGGTGVGKSSLINGLAGASIAEAGEARPTTTQIVVYHHRDVPLGGLPSELTWGARFVAHEREELRFKVLVDTPDLDSFLRDHRERTLALLKAAGLVLYVFSPEKYLEERVWSVLREERRFSATAAVLNKADTLGREELERVAEDLAQRLASVGLGSIRVFKTQSGLRSGAGGSAGHGEDDAPHAETEAGRGSRSGVDELADLRRFLERELREGDATRIVRENRRRTLANLRAAVERLAGPELEPRLAAVGYRIAARAEAASTRLVEVIAPELAAVEAELAPLATLRQHERFRGPLRAWLALCDFATIGLAGLIDRLVGRPPRGAADVVERIFGTARARDVEALLRDEERRLQDELYAADLPIARWRELATELEGRTVLTELASAVRERFEARSAVASAQRSFFVDAASGLGALVPAAAIFGGLWLLVRDLFTGQYLGLGLLAHLTAVVVLFFLALHALVAVFLPTTGRLGKGLGLAAASAVLPRLFDEVFARYRAEVDADVRDLLAPLEALETLVADEVGALGAAADEEHGDDDATPRALAWPSAEADSRDEAAKERAQSDEARATAPAPAIDPAAAMLRALERE